MTPWDGVPPPAWSDRECVCRMIRGVIAKVQRLQREGALSARDSEGIRDALSAAIVESQDARWRRARPEDGVEVVGSVPPQPTPLPTEPDHSTSLWVPSFLRGRS